MVVMISEDDTKVAENFTKEVIFASLKMKRKIIEQKYYAKSDY